MDLDPFAAEVGTGDPVTVAGSCTRGGPVSGVRCVSAPAGIDWIQADEMTVQCGAGTSVADLAAALAELGQRTLLPVSGTVGGALSTGWSGVRRLGDGPMRDALLQARYVGADGAVVKAGGPTVKNVSGFDLCRLLVGSRGTLGFLGEVILRTRPVSLLEQWFATSTDDPLALLARLYRPAAALWDGAQLTVLLEGHPADVSAEAAVAGLAPVDGPPALPPARVLVRSSALGLLRTIPGAVVEIGAGLVHVHDTASVPAEARPAPPAPAVLALRDRIKHGFDPAGRLNPGVVVG